MSLKFEIDDESFAQLPDDISGLYERREDCYRLKVEGIDPADELKEALRKERKSRAEARDELEKLRASQAAAEDARAKEKGEFKELYEREQKSAAELREKLESQSKRIEIKELEASAAKLTSELTRDTKRAELLKKEIMAFARYSEDGVHFEMGGVKVDSAKILAHITDNYPFLVDGSGATGGGATGGKGGGASQPKGNMGGTRAERTAAIAAQFNL